LLGRVSHEQVEDYYSLIDITPFPRKPQPATEMVKHEETGLIFEKGNVQALSDTLGRLIGDQALRMWSGKAGRQWVEAEQMWEKTATRGVQVIEKNKELSADGYKS